MFTEYLPRKGYDVVLHRNAEPRASNSNPALLPWAKLFGISRRIKPQTTWPPVCCSSGSGPTFRTQLKTARRGWRRGRILPFESPAPPDPLRRLAAPGTGPDPASSRRSITSSPMSTATSHPQGPGVVPAQRCRELPLAGGRRCGASSAGFGRWLHVSVSTCIR